MDMFNFEHSMGFPLTRLDLWVRSYLLVAWHGRQTRLVFRQHLAVSAKSKKLQSSAIARPDGHVVSDLDGRPIVVNEAKEQAPRSGGGGGGGGYRGGGGGGGNGGGGGGRRERW